MKRLALVLLLFVSVCMFAEERKLKVAVMEIEDKSGKLDKAMLERAAEYLRSKLAATNQYILISKDRQVKEMMKAEKKESWKECYDQSCRIQVGQALSADTVTYGIITFFGGTYTISLEMRDLAKEATVKAADAEFNGTEKGMKEAVDSLVAQIAGKKKGTTFQEGKIGEIVEEWEVGQGEETVVKFSSTPSEAVVMVDGRILCQKTPCSKMITQGKHEITMQKENYVPYSKAVSISKGHTINAELEPDFAWLTVKSVVKIDVKLDGVPLTAPFSKQVINPGAHHLETADSCYHLSGEKFTIKRGETKEITLDLKEKESAIKVTAQDKDGNDIEAEVSVDGKTLGTAPGTFKVGVCAKEVVVATKKGQYKETLKLQEKKVTSIEAVLKKKGLQWSKKTPKEMNWNDAIKYCKNLEEEGYSDWHLPTISELRTLIQNCPNTESGGSCKVTNECLSYSECRNDACGGCGADNSGKYSILGDTNWLWSASERSDDSSSSWGVNFYGGHVGHDSKSNDIYVRCAR